MTSLLTHSPPGTSVLGVLKSGNLPEYWSEKGSTAFLNQLLTHCLCAALEVSVTSLIMLSNVSQDLWSQLEGQNVWRGSALSLCSKVSGTLHEGGLFPFSFFKGILGSYIFENVPALNIFKLTNFIVYIFNEFSWPFWIYTTCQNFISI